MTKTLCGVLLVLAVSTRAAPAQSWRVGAHYGANLSNGHWEDERLGLQGSVPVVGVLEAAGGFSVFTDWPGVSGYTGSAWQGYATLRVRPRGPMSFASFGYGFTLWHASLRNEAAQTDTAGSNFTDVIVLGAEAPIPHVRPFVDLYLIDILDRESAVGVNLLMGVQIPFPIGGRNR
jgi:hypothetical protein